MIEIRYAETGDAALWTRYDPHISKEEWIRKIASRRCYLLLQGAEAIGVMRYNLFWDTIPFLTFLYIDAPHRGKGVGKQAMCNWETEMRAAGFSRCMTSTQVDETAQGFYRRLGYKDAGCLLLDVQPIAQPAELFLVKQLL